MWLIDPWAVSPTRLDIGSILINLCVLVPNSVWKKVSTYCIFLNGWILFLGTVLDTEADAIPVLMQLAD